MVVGRCKLQRWAHDFKAYLEHLLTAYRGCYKKSCKRLEDGCRVLCHKNVTSNKVDIRAKKVDMVEILTPDTRAWAVSNGLGLVKRCDSGCGRPPLSVAITYDTRP